MSNMIKHPLPLGQRVRIREALVRRRGADGYSWERISYASFRNKTGIIVGRRTLWNSEWESDGWEYPHSRYLNNFAHPVPAYLVAIDLRSIEKVPLESVEVIDG